ncbi:hypothetical protein DSL72_004944 [Monilinia vaccinii-corymbosi]|uniref:Extracellular membrane protein CFEM domain-containing protein n=1 Tax=Monilinia vaccinii-corymbosi TaxID=61207 RepID=A0A8A3P5L5_9HELO|nr:hypothetical protein DSL72_004944 [Monilinia vaccinii-corymbosi]
MRPILFSLLVSRAIVSAYESPTSDGCMQGNFHDLVIRNSCGDDLSIVKCLAEDVDLRRLDQIEQCFIAGGCDAIDSTVSAVWFSYECNDRQGSVEELTKEDLRKRAAEASSTTTTASSSASTTATTASSTSGTITSATSSGTATSTSTLVCSTTSYYSTSVCSYGTGASTGATLGCAATSVGSVTCAAGVLCTTAASGDDICMLIDNTLTTSGLAVTIFFGVSIGAFIIGLIIVGLRDHAAAAKLKAERIALLDAESKEAMEAYNQKRSKSVRQPNTLRNSEANMPLISGPKHEQRHSSEGPPTYH